MGKKKYKKQEKKGSFITQEVLDKECLTLEKSKELILRKVEQHIHRP